MFIAMFPWFEYLNDMLKRALFTMVLFPWTVLHADTFHVDILANGQTWKDAFPDLQQALALAGDGDEVLVAKGTYQPTPTGDRDISFVESLEGVRHLFFVQLQISPSP